MSLQSLQQTIQVASIKSRSRKQNQAPVPAVSFVLWFTVNNISRAMSQLLALALLDKESNRDFLVWPTHSMDSCGLSHYMIVAAGVTFIVYMYICSEYVLLGSNLAPKCIAHAQIHVQGCPGGGLLAEGRQIGDYTITVNTVCMGDKIAPL